MVLGVSFAVSGKVRTYVKTKRLLEAARFAGLSERFSHDRSGFTPEENLDRPNASPHILPQYFNDEIYEGVEQSVEAAELGFDEQCAYQNFEVHGLVNGVRTVIGASALRECTVDIDTRAPMDLPVDRSFSTNSCDTPRPPTPAFNTVVRELPQPPTPALNTVVRELPQPPAPALNTVVRELPQPGDPIYHYAVREKVRRWPRPGARSGAHATQSTPRPESEVNSKAQATSEPASVNASVVPNEKV